jgi:hypothetical protein
MTKLRIGVSLLLVILMGGLAAAIVVFRAARPDLKTELTIETADLGIPGITKVYDARVVNHGRWPVRVTRCNFIDDTMTHGAMVAYAIQRWDKQQQKWQQVMGSSRRSFCHPYPLGIVRADLTTQWLWPGKSLSIGEEATAARDGLQIGDRARFVIFTAEPGDYASSLPTQEFTIDEHPTSDVDFRVRH